MSDGINVLSFFDGMACGRIALDRAKIKVNKYLAAEIKPHAIKVAKKNYPDIIHIGDVMELNWFGLPRIDLFIGGSPCQDITRLKPGANVYSDKSKLFFEYVRVLKELQKINPKMNFLLENVVGDKTSIDVISEYLEVKPIRINSNLVSYQNRDRYYWTNIDNVEKPTDLKISFQDFKDTDDEYISKFKVNRTASREIMWGNGINGKCPNVTHRSKINCLTVKQDRWSNSGLVEYKDFCRYLTTRELEMAQTVPIGYTDCLSKNQAEDVLGDGWTIDVIAHIFKNIK